MRHLRPWRRPNPPSVLTAVACASLVVPFSVVAIRYLASSGHVYLSDDLALMNLHVRDAMQFRQQLGPFDRFGWSHPGPAVFYALAVVAAVIGQGARADFVGAIVLNLVAALGTVWVVRRRAGASAALWCAACLGLLAIVLGSTSPGATTTSESPLGALVTPWNPDVVIVPLVLFCVLAAAGATGSPLSLLGAAIAGSFVVQTNFSTFPLVVAFLVLAVASALWRAWRRGGAGSTGRPPHRRRPVVPGVAGAVLLGAMWLPPFLQQLGNSPGNLTLIWRFFTTAHRTVPLSHALWAVVAVDGELVFGLPQEMRSSLGTPHAFAGLILAATLLVGAAGLVVALRRRVLFASALAASSLVGFVVAVVAVTRIVGPVYGYLVVWQVAIPIAGLIGLGVALVGDVADAAETTSPTPVPAAPVSTGPAPAGPAPAAPVPAAPVPAAPVSVGSAPAGPAPAAPIPAAPASPPATAGPVRRRSPATSRPVVGALCLLSVLVGALLTVETADLPPLQHASDPTVADAWRLVATRIRPGPNTIFVGDAGTSLLGVFTMFGLVNELEARGFHPRVSPFWKTQVGPWYVSNGRDPLQIVLSPPSAADRRLRGYVGQTRYADISIAPGPPTP